MAEQQQQWERINKVIYDNTLEQNHEFYTKWAATYDADLSGVESVANKNMVRATIEYLEKGESSLMLDIAAGTGDTANTYKEAGFKGQIDAVEMNAAMLNVARSKGLYRKYICHTVTNDDPLRVENGTYDAVTAAGSFLTNHLPQGCIRQMANALKPGGLLIFNSRITPGNAEYQKVLFGHLDDMIKANKIKLDLKEEVPFFLTPSRETGKPITGFVFVYRRLAD